MKLKTRWLGLGLLLATALALGATQKSPISPQRLQQHIQFLAAPEMKGRASGTPELDRAARYIAREFRRAGLEPGIVTQPGGTRKSFFQEFTVTVGAELGKENHAEATLDAASASSGDQPLRFQEDYVPLSFSDSGGAALGLVFAGYGITSEEHRYDDYAHLDVKDKAVLVLRHEPQEDDANSVFAGRALTPHASLVNKAINARNHGARALVLVNDPAAHPGEEDLLIRSGSLSGPDHAGLLVVHVRRDVADRWLQPSGRTLAELQTTIDEKLEPRSFALADWTLRLRVDVRRITAPTQNVVGILRGSDPQLAREAIVIGAHYDHLGLGDRNTLSPSSAGQVHPGADDNASGTAAVLELARALAGRRRDLRRTIVFLAFSGEELGLLGSLYYTRNPAWPLERTVAMINLDMVGRPRDNTLYVGGMGTSPVFKEIVERANTVRLTLSYSPSGHGGSDHISFYAKNIPVLFFFSGLHADYHKPSDLPDRIQFADQARVVELALGAAQALAARDDRPTFVRVQEAQPVAAGGGGGYGAYFGSIPDMGEQVEGVKFADVRDASPAAKAGLKAGDILVEFAGKPIKNLYDFTYALRSHKPGEEVSVTVLRGTERLTVKVTLAQRK